MSSEATQIMETQTKAAPAAVPGSADAMIQVEALTYEYSGRKALDALSLEVGRGELFGLLGPNGSGKSTLLRILASLRAPQGGSARVDGQDVATHPAAVRHRLGVAFQAPSLDKKLTVEENIRFQGYLFGLSGRELATRVDEMLQRFGLADRRGERAEILSGGLKRRVELAKALLHKPLVLLLDEPSTGLDPAARLEFWEVLGDMRENDQLTVVVATHLMDEAERCDRVALLDQGRLVALNAPQVLRSELGGDTVILECAQPSDLALKIKERMALETRIERGAVRIETKDGMALAQQLMAAFPEQVRAVRVGKPTLEDVFVTLTGRELDIGEDTQ